jgi:hypothetical protein
MMEYSSRHGEADGDDIESGGQLIRFLDDTSPDWRMSVEEATGFQFKNRKIYGYGCGAFGCVFPTKDPGVVVKMTHDMHEGPFMAAVQKVQTEPNPYQRLFERGFVKVFGVYRFRSLEVRCGEFFGEGLLCPVFAVVRENTKPIQFGLTEMQNKLYVALNEYWRNVNALENVTLAATEADSVRDKRLFRVRALQVEIALEDALTEIEWLGGVNIEAVLKFFLDRGEPLLDVRAANVGLRNGNQAVIFDPGITPTSLPGNIARINPMDLYV